MKADPLYPFGFGLSYTSFVYSDLQLSASKVKKNANVSVTVTLTNTGGFPSDEVAQLYLTHENAGEDAPLFALKGFRRVSLAPGASTRVSFMLTPEQLSLIDEKGQPFQAAGKIRISVAGSLPTHRSEELGAAKAVETELEITGK
jgi:beta-glucosidase